MSKSQITWICVGVGALLLLFFVVGTYNTLVSDEEGVRAQEKIIDLSIDKMGKKIEASGAVVNNFSQTLKEVLATTVGEGGRAASAGAVFHAVAERYPNVPEGLWKDLAATSNAEIESMSAAQASKVARIQAFRTRLRNPTYLLAKAVGGFPTINLDEADQLIIGKAARQARETHTLETPDPFAKSK